MGHSCRIDDALTRWVLIIDLVARRVPKAMVGSAGGMPDARGLAATLRLMRRGRLGWHAFLCKRRVAAGHDGAKAGIVAASGEVTVRTSVFDAVPDYSWPDGIMGSPL